MRTEATRIAACRLRGPLLVAENIHKSTAATRPVKVRSGFEPGGEDRRVLASRGVRLGQEHALHLRRHAHAPDSGACCSTAADRQLADPRPRALRNRTFVYTSSSNTCCRNSRRSTNVLTPAYIGHSVPAWWKSRAKCGAGHRTARRSARAPHQTPPRELSCGELQRPPSPGVSVAILVCLLADEPTGNLDAAPSGARSSNCCALEPRGEALTM